MIEPPPPLVTELSVTVLHKNKFQDKLPDTSGCDHVKRRSASGTSPPSPDQELCRWTSLGAQSLGPVIDWRMWPPNYGAGSASGLSMIQRRSTSHGHRAV